VRASMTRWGGGVRRGLGRVRSWSGEETGAWVEAGVPSWMAPLNTPR
jgi:hypothetical protein